MHVIMINIYLYIYIYVYIYKYILIMTHAHANIYIYIFACACACDLPIDRNACHVTRGSAAVVGGATGRIGAVLMSSSSSACHDQDRKRPWYCCIVRERSKRNVHSAISSNQLQVLAVQIRWFDVLTWAVLTCTGF